MLRGFHYAMTGSASRPWIVHITSHDLGRYLGCYGMPGVVTPNLDRLAETGVRCANAFCTAPQCSPSRASLYTGRYPHNTGVIGLTHGNFGWDLDPAVPHLAELLHGAGYRTVGCAVMHEFQNAKEHGIEEIVALKPFAQEGEKPIHAAPVARAVEHTLEAHADSTQPLYLQLGFFEPHRDISITSGWPTNEPDTRRGIGLPGYLEDEPSAREDWALFQGSIRELDAAMGRVLDKLDALGRADDTLIVFSADHGEPFPGAKCTLYEPGLAIAMLWRWPAGGVAGGRVVEDMVSNVDGHATLCELLGIDPGEHEGRSFAAGLRGEPFDGRDEIFGELTYHTYYFPTRSVRTDRYKLIADFEDSGAVMDPSQQWRPMSKPTRHPDPKAHKPDLIELFDLENDPLEMRNLVAEAAHAEALGACASRLLRHMRESDDLLITDPPRSPTHRRTLERLEQAASVSA